MTKTPAEAGFRMPAEWEKHEGTWLQWPQAKLYRDYELKLERMWLMMVDALHAHENVHLIVADEVQRDRVADQRRYFGIGAANLHQNEDEILVCPVDLALIEEVRAAWSFPFRDRRVDSYGGLTKLFLDYEMEVGS